MDYELKKRDAPISQESDIQVAAVKAIQKVLGGKDLILSILEQNIREALESESREQMRRLTGGWKNCRRSFCDWQMAKRNMGCCGWDS